MKNRDQYNQKSIELVNNWFENLDLNKITSLGDFLQYKYKVTVIDNTEHDINQDLFENEYFFIFNDINSKTYLHKYIDFLPNSRNHRNIHNKFICYNYCYGRLSKKNKKELLSFFNLDEFLKKEYNPHLDRNRTAHLFSLHEKVLCHILHLDLITENEFNEHKESIMKIYQKIIKRYNDTNGDYKIIKNNITTLNHLSKKYPKSFNSLIEGLSKDLKNSLLAILL